MLEILDYAYSVLVGFCFIFIGVGILIIVGYAYALLVQMVVGSHVSKSSIMKVSICVLMSLVSLLILSHNVGGAFLDGKLIDILSGV